MAIYGGVLEKGYSTAVLKCVTGCFTEIQIDEEGNYCFAENLVLVHERLLQVYAIKRESKMKESEKDFEEIKTSSDNKQIGNYKSLEFMFPYYVHNKILDVSTIYLPKYCKHGLVILMQECKIAIVVYEPSFNDFKILSLHCFEDENLKNGKLTFTTPVILRIDPDNHFIALLAYEVYLIIIEMKTEENLPSKLEDQNCIGGNSILKTSIIIDLYEHNIRHVADFAIGIQSIFNGINMIQQKVIYIIHEFAPSLQNYGLDGVFILSADFIFYIIDNSNPITAYGMNVNSLQAKSFQSSPFQFKNSSKLNINLDMCKYCFLKRNCLILSVKSQNLYYLNIVPKDNNFLDIKWNLLHTEFYTLPSSIAKIMDNLFFISSYYNDSLLIQLENDFGNEDFIIDYQILKKRKLNDGTQGDEKMSFFQPLLLNVLKRIPTFAPIIDFVQPELDSSKGINQYEIVACSGYGKEGYISHMINYAPHDLILEYKMDDIQYMQSIPHPDIANTHKYLIISSKSKTLTSETLGSLNDITQNVELISEKPTINISILFHNEEMFIVQMTAFHLRILNQNGMKIYDWGLPEAEEDVDEPIPTEELKEEDNEISESKSSFHQIAIIRNLIVILNTSGHLIAFLFENNQLYEQNFENLCKFEQNEKYSAIYSKKSDLKKASESKIIVNLLFTAKTGGKFEILKASGFLLNEVLKTDEVESNIGDSQIQFERIFICEYVNEGLALIMNTLPYIYEEIEFEFGTSPKIDNSESPYKKINKNLLHKSVTDITSNTALNIMETQNSSFLVSDIYCDHLNSKLLLILILTNDDVLIYEGFEDTFLISPFPFVFKRFQHFKTFENLIDKPILFKTNYERIHKLELFEENLDEAERKMKTIENKEGILITGVQTPFWILSKDKKLFAHYFERRNVKEGEEERDGGIKGFCSLNLQKKKEFIYSEGGLLKIGSLNAKYNLFSEYPYIRYKFPMVPRKILLYQATQHQVMISVFDFHLQLPPSIPNPISQTQEEQKEPAKLRISVTNCINVIGFEDGRIIDTFRFEANEIVLAISLVSLKKEDTDIHGSYLVAASSLMEPECEDTYCKSQLIIFTVDKKTGKLFKIHEETKLKGVITNVASVDGYLAVTIGSKLDMFLFYQDSLYPQNTALKKIAFFDAKILISSISIIKSYILLGDVEKSIMFLRFKEELEAKSKSLTLLSEYSMNYLGTSSCEYWMDPYMPQKLRIICADSNKNAHIFSYSTPSPTLDPSADIHLASTVCKLYRFTSCKDDISLIQYASFEGNHGLILPLDEKTYKRLSMLQDALINSIPFKGGTNPKAFRALKSNHSDFKQTKKNIIDLEPLFQYLNLSCGIQKKIGRSIGSSREKIIDSLISVLQDY